MSRQKREKPMEGRPDDVRFGTPPDVAEHRASRLQADTIIEAGAGAGFQTRALARHAGRVVAIEIDPGKLERGEFADNVLTVRGDALDPEIIALAAENADGRTTIFLDPERPPAGRRTLADIEPDVLAFFRAYGNITEDIAVELPPFLSDVPGGEREYVSVEGELNRLTLYRGGLKQCDVSVVALPEGRRLEHDGPLPELQERDVAAKHVLVPDKAVEHAGLTAKVLPDRYRSIDKGFVTEAPGSRWCTTYRVLAHGTKEDILECLPSMDAATVIVHGSMSQDEQRELLRELNPCCTGDRRLHLFVDGWLLAKRENH